MGAHEGAVAGASMEQVVIAQKLEHEGVGGLFIDLLRGCELLDAPGIHHRDAIRDFQRFLLVVGHENGGDMDGVMQPAQPAPQFAPHRCIQRAKRLVEQQHARLHRQRAGERHALALAAGELRRVALTQISELDQIEQ